VPDQLSTITHIVGWVVLATLALLLTINGLYMAISPTRWFMLPRWFRGTGTLRPEHHSTGFHALVIRFYGMVIIAAIIWVCYDSCFVR
jgi:hypothetical protein